jgi:hypothetical protein
MFLNLIPCLLQSTNTPVLRMLHVPVIAVPYGHTAAVLVDGLM